MAIPDWKNPDDYAYAKKLPLSGWAWEFLRRSERYREAFGTYVERVAVFENKFGQSWRSNPDARVFFPDLLEEESERDWMLRCDGAGIHATCLRLDQAMGREFFMHSMYDPDKKYSKVIKFLKPDKLPLLVSHLDELGPFSQRNDYTERDEIDDEVAVIAFSLTDGFHRQLEAAHGVLKSARKQRRVSTTRDFTQDVPKWLTYLRVLDAQIAGASVADTAEVMFSHLAKKTDPVEHASEQRKQARKWQTPIRQSKLLTLHFTQQ